MKLYDVLPDNALFAAMNAIKPFPWSDTVTPEQMDLTYKENYTDKGISRTVLRLLGEDSALSQDAIDKLAKMLYTMYYDKWSNLYNVFLSANVGMGSGYKETIQETIEHDNATTDKGTIDTMGSNRGQISAFNSADFTDKDNTETQSVDTRDLAGSDTGTQKRDYVRTGYGEYYSTQYETSIKALTAYSLCDIIYVDVNNLLTLHIYE